jgi:hypothetical protein
MVAVPRTRSKEQGVRLGVDQQVQRQEEKEKKIPVVQPSLGVGVGSAACLIECRRSTAGKQSRIAEKQKGAYADFLPLHDASGYNFGKEELMQKHDHVLSLFLISTTPSVNCSTVTFNPQLSTFF